MRRGCALFLAASLMIATAPASANLFTHILREAGEAGGKTAGHAASHLGAVGKAAEYLQALAKAPKAALAAHATPEGHWQFVNKEGQVFTVGAPDEFKRVLPTLVPDAVASGDTTKMSLYLSEESVFQNRVSLDQLPKDAELHVVTDGGAFPVTRKGSGASAVLTAQVKPHLIVTLSDQALFDEIVATLDRSLNKSNIRTIAFEHGAAQRLTSAPKLDPINQTPLVDQLDPSQLSSALQSIRGQTALVVGRVEGGKVHFSPSSGAEISRDADELIRAAADNDVNLVILQTDAGRQPGGRNWLWQKIEVGGLSDAAKSATFGDFLDALAARRGGFSLSAARDGPGRVQISATPSESATTIVSETGSWLDDSVGHITGEIVTKAMDIHGRDQSAESELDARLIPGIPTFIQIPYFASLIAGLIGWATVRAWWRRVWPTSEPVAGQGWLRNWLVSLPRAIVFVLAFLPVAGVPAMVWQLAIQTWETVTAPFRWVHRRFLRREV